MYVFLRLEEGDKPASFADLELEASRIDVVIRDPLSGTEDVHTALEGFAELSLPRSATGVPLLVFAAVVPSGEIAQVRLVVESARARFQTFDGLVSEAATVPSGPQTGIKLVPRETLVLPDQGELAMVGNVQLAEQTVEAPGNGLLFKPVVPAEELTRPSVHGQLAEDDVLLSVTTQEFPLTGVRLERAKILSAQRKLRRSGADRPARSRRRGRASRAPSAAHPSARPSIGPPRFRRILA